MSSRAKYFYALKEDWPEVLSELEEKAAVDYVEERALADWRHPRYETWRDLPLGVRPRGQIFWRRFHVRTPPGSDVPEGKRVEGAHPAYRPQLYDAPDTILFDPQGLDEDYSDEIGAPFIKEGWIATQFYDTEGSKLIFNALSRAMQKYFANYHGTLFGPLAYRKIVAEGWKFGQYGPFDDWDLTDIKTPKGWTGETVSTPKKKSKPIMINNRLSYEDSCRRLQSDYLEADEIPQIPDHLPRYDDPEPLGVNFFRTFVGDGADLSNLTLPRTFFGRSEIDDTNFRNTDFTESCLCWNDFSDVDFSDAVLAKADLRASEYVQVKFTGADLCGADLRRSWFENCDFEGARMADAVLTPEQGESLLLSDVQRAAIAWTDDDGPEPGGG